MADTKPSDLPALTGANADPADLVVVSDMSVPASRKMTLAELTTYLQAGRGMSRVKKLLTDHSITSTTGTEVTDLTMALEIGTYVFDYYLMVQSSSTAVGPMMGVNFDGTAAFKSMLAFWGDATTAITAETHIMDDQGVLTFGYISGMANRAWTTTAPNMGTTVGVTAVNTDIPMRITGMFIVTAAGNLELWHSSETANATTVEAGSSLVVTRTA